MGAQENASFSTTQKDKPFQETLKALITKWKLHFWKPGDHKRHQFMTKFHSEDYQRAPFW
jgi:Tfp pilus assembly protein PilP